MTRTPINRGFAFITEREDGSADVVVAETLTRDQAPARVVASHHQQTVELGRTVRTVRAGKNTVRTVEPVLIRGGDEAETVRVRADR